MSVLVDYSLLKDRRGGAVVARIWMRNGVISWEARSDTDRQRIEPYMRNTTVIARNRKFDDDRSAYMAAPGTWTWLEETVEQRLYYGEGYGYMVAVVPPTSAYLILTTSAMTPAYRGLHRECFNESAVRLITRTPTNDVRALNHLLAVWEAGFSEDGLIERAEDAKAVYAKLDTSNEWELVYSCPPGSGPPSEGWTCLGIDVANWAYIGNVSVLSEVDVGGISLNLNGLLPDETSARQLLRMHDEELTGYELREVWVHTW